jgi:hypothetical protein
MRLPRARFKISSLMIAVALVAGVLAIMRSAAALVLSVGLLYIALIGVLWWMFRGFRRFSALCVGVVAVLTNTLCAFLCVCCLGMSGIVLMSLVWLFAFPIIVGIGTAWASSATRREARFRRSALVAWPLVVVLAALPLTMLLTHWPFRLAFFASKAALERLADQVATGQPVRRPVRAGLFLVVGSAIDPASGNVGLIIDPDPAGRSGFVRLSPGPNRRRSGPFNNLNYDLRVCDEWWYECED